MPSYFLYFFADFFFSSRTSFWTRFSIGCAHTIFVMKRGRIIVMKKTPHHTTKEKKKKHHQTEGE